MRKGKDFLTALKNKTLLCDGAMGTMLRERGADMVIKAAKDVVDISVICQFSLLPDGVDSSGESLQSVAEFLHNEVPGITIPPDIRQRMKDAGDKALNEGVAIAAELIKQCRGMVSGVYMMPPFGRYDMVERIMAEIA